MREAILRFALLFTTATHCASTRRAESESAEELKHGRETTCSTSGLTALTTHQACHLVERLTVVSARLAVDRD